MKSKKLPRNAIKDAIDNLPSGICFFNENGIPVLCNRQMHKLVFALTGRDLQLMTDLTDALNCLPTGSPVVRDGESYILPDGSVWHFSSRTVQGESAYTEYLAANVTELYRKKQELEKTTAEHEQVVEGLRGITRNVIGITREEEILAMKMQVHNEVGIALQKLRHYRKGGCPPEEKEAAVAELENAVRFLTDGIGTTDDPDDLTQLLQTAASLGVAVEINGSVPAEERLKELFLMALQECVTNTLRHAGGSSVSVEIADGQAECRVRLTNDGALPRKPIVEGGGLTALRRQIERAGGSMAVESAPAFALNIRLPKESEEGK